MAYLKAKISIYLAWKAQIILLFTKKIIILEVYSNFTNIFSKTSIIELLKHSDINEYVINLDTNKKPLYRSIYSVSLIKLKILKISIKTNIANSFICSFKSSTNIFILFV